MTPKETLRLDLPQGLTARRAAALTALIAEATGLDEGAGTLPWLAPALLFAAPSVQDRLNLPRPGPGEALVHDYQALRLDAHLPLDTALTANARPEIGEKSVSYRFELSVPCGAPLVTLDTALRLVPARDVGAAQPANIPQEALQDATCGAQMPLRQEQVDAYLALSGDRNPIHSQLGAARALGLPAPVVPGLLLASLIQPHCLRVAPGHRLAGLRARFMAPAYVGRHMRICVQPRGQDAKTAHIRLRAYILDETGRGLAICDLFLARPPAP